MADITTVVMGEQKNAEMQEQQKRIREIQIVRGEEFKVQVREQIDATDPFIEEYRSAAALLESILEAAQKEKKQEEEPKKESPMDFRHQNQDYNNNIIAFCGNRGDGKSSAMMTFIHEALQPKEVLFKKNSIVRKMNFTDTIYVDPSALDNVHNILDIVLAQMFKNFTETYEKGRAQRASGLYSDKQNRQERERLLQCFQAVYRSISLIKDSTTILKEEYDDEGSISKLSKLSESMRLKENLQKLLTAYFQYMPLAAENENGGHTIIVAIDDLDLSFAAAYKMAEEIRKYLILPGIVIVMAVRITQLHFCVEEYNIKHLQQNFKNENNQQMRQEVQEMAERYVSKLIPLTHRVHLTKVQDFHDVQIVYVDKKGVGEKSKENKEIVVSGSVVEYVLKMIYEKTGMILRPFVEGHSLILPENMRGIVDLLVLLNNMPSLDAEGSREKIQSKNIKILLDSYYRGWISAFPAKNKEERQIRRELEKLTNFDERMNLHTGIGRVLERINEEYSGTGEKEEKIISNNEIDQLRTSTDLGRNSMCFIMNFMRKIRRRHYKDETKQYMAAVSFLYTMKIHRILSERDNKESLVSFTGQTVWGYDLENTIPATSKKIERARFIISTKKALEIIGGSLGLSKEHPFFVERKDSKLYTSNELLGTRESMRAWIVFALLCNNYKESEIKPTMRLRRDTVKNNYSLIHDNYSLSNRVQVSIENYLVRLCMLDSLCEYLNLEEKSDTGKKKAGDSDPYRVFQEIICDIKTQNAEIIGISRDFISNVDIVQELPEQCESRVKRKDNTKNRSILLIEKFLRNVAKYVKNARPSTSRETERDAAAEEASNDELLVLRYRKKGKKKDEKIDIAQLYAELIENGELPEFKKQVRLKF